MKESSNLAGTIKGGIKYQEFVKELDLARTIRSRQNGNKYEKSKRRNYGDENKRMQGENGNDIGEVGRDITYKEIDSICL